ncbi:MAG: DUF4038 domain-containing protein, partial [Kiritimatiellae bacterium]|nr:DUF4038 domain-containing protein [Verrucomicrobiota bacterium]MCG2661001.1 DUF4038 domain-containing protein [Kiritimatiellia bacterium]
GANGIWQVNTRQKLYGPSPHGMSWGNTPWEDAYQLPGSEQLGLAKRLLARYPWWQFEPHPEWTEPGWTKELNDLPFTCGRHDVPMAAGIPRKVRFIYIPLGTWLQWVKEIEKKVRYRAKFFNPVNGDEQNLGEVKPDAKGNWKCPRMPMFQDWVLVLEAIGAK